MRRTLSLIALVAVAVLAGCGGGSTTYSAAPTRACLKGKDRVVKIRDKVDFVASNVLGGAFNVRFRTNQVTLMFSEQREETARIVTVYKRVKGKNIGLEDVLRVEGNVVMLWGAHPDEDELDTIYDCLK